MYTSAGRGECAAAKGRASQKRVAVGATLQRAKPGTGVARIPGREEGGEVVFFPASRQSIVSKVNGNSSAECDGTDVDVLRTEKSQPIPGVGGCF